MLVYSYPHPAPRVLVGGSFWEVAALRQGVSILPFLSSSLLRGPPRNCSFPTPVACAQALPHLLGLHPQRGGRQGMASTLEIGHLSWGAPVTSR